MATSLIQHTQDKSNLKIVLFTDQMHAAQVFARDQHPEISFEFIEIPNYQWPEATLLRYEVLSRKLNEIEVEYFIYIDSDMMIMKDLLAELQQINVNNKMYFVAHPGYRLRNSSLITSTISLLKMRILRAINPKYRGAWESNPESTAYIPIRQRKIYLHGAFWFAQRESFLSFVRTCAKNVAIDSQNGVMASWHDESHLNSFYVIHGGNILSSRFSWHPRYAKFLDKEPIIVSVENFGKTR